MTRHPAFPNVPALEPVGPLANPDDSIELRRMLAWCYAGFNLYCDDGELQDTRERPFIDFKRDSLKDIKLKMEERSLNRLYNKICQGSSAKESVTQ